MLLLLLFLPQIGSVTKDDFPLETLGPILKDVQQEVRHLDNSAGPQMLKLAAAVAQCRACSTVLCARNFLQYV
jgi:hypothetical protein